MNLDQVRSYHPNSFLSTFFCDYSAIFSTNTMSSFFRDMEAKHEISMKGKIIKVF